MRELWKKYTRTQSQRCWFVFIGFLLLMAILSAIFIQPLFVLGLFALFTLGPIGLVIWLIFKWISRGEEDDWYGL